jgi:hypothetical protein
MSVTSRFTNAFDSMNQEHVMWLKTFFDFAKNMGSIDDFINKNPMRVKITKSEMIEWVHVHFALSMKYARDVLDGKAFIPGASSSV